MTRDEAFSAKTEVHPSIAHITERRLRRYVAEVGPVVSAARAELDRAARQGDEAAMARARDRLDVLATRVRSGRARVQRGAVRPFGGIFVNSCPSSPRRPSSPSTVSRSTTPSHPREDRARRRSFLSGRRRPPFFFGANEHPPGIDPAVVIVKSRRRAFASPAPSHSRRHP